MKTGKRPEGGDHQLSEGGGDSPEKEKRGRGRGGLIRGGERKKNL